MIRFLLKCFYFIVVVLFFNLISFFFVKSIYYSPYLVFPNKNFESFIFSDSHGLALSRHGEVYDVYNYSYGSDSYIDIKRKVIYLINNSYKIDKVYITVDNYSLSPYRERMNNIDRSQFYLSISDFENFVSYLHSGFVNYYFVFLNPKVRTVINLFLYSKISSIFNGSLKKKKEWSTFSDLDKINLAKFRINGQFPSGQKSQILERALLDIIALSKEHGFVLIGVKFPLSKHYINSSHGLNFGADSILLANDIKVLDFSEIYLNNEDYFKDPDHLNSFGGKVFSRTLFLDQY